MVLDRNHHHRLAPHALVLRRSADELQVGLEPSLVVPASYAPVLTALAEGVGTGALLDIAEDAGLGHASTAELLDALEAHAFLHGIEDRPRSGTTVRIVGAGVFASQVAAAISAAGVGTVYLADLPQRQAPPGETQAKQDDRVAILATSLQVSYPEVQIRTTRHFAKPEASLVGLTVVVADGPEPDRLVTDLLVPGGAAHLLVRCAGDEVTVGPLVVPGVTSCVRCADLARRDADERWPSLLHQLTSVQLEPEPSLVGWGVATAVTQTLAFLGDGRPETLGHTLELRTSGHTMRLRPWPVHSDCHCRAADARPAILWSGRGE